ncbi:LysR family transcriptional regulator [Aquimarina longa]|uniref:LysR family transcriptional regulator n=1 Tax=Aquimarina longa TaxID=1080221 RepID=UPI000780E7DD|nr:LysR family transcriptional regulator [Aquimarina longa]
MFDYKLHVFYTVANRLSFSKAGEELHITQPAVTRHIKQIEEHFNQKLFERQGNSISLTKAGKVLLAHSKEIFEHYKVLQYEMNELINKTEGILRIAASTTVAQYILPEVLAKFHKKHPKVKVTLMNANTESVEQSILDVDVELGFIEGKSKNREISYHPFLKDEIVLVVAKGHPLFNTNSIHLDFLSKMPFVLREEGSGTLETIIEALRKKNIFKTDLNIQMRLGSSESIKSYINDNNSVAFLSINTILKELKSGELGIIDINNFSIERTFYYIFRQGHHSSLSALFLKFLQNHYNISL